MASDKIDSSSFIKKYGLTAAKKAMIDTLAQDVENANYAVEKHQAIVSALTLKAQKYQVHLKDAELTRSTTKHNKDLIDELVQQVVNLQSQSEIANKEMIEAAKKSTALLEEVNSLMLKLNYASSLVSKLFNIINRAKATNPLISDQIVHMINTVVTDANNAVALTFVAFKTSYEAYIINRKSDSALKFTKDMSVSLYNSFTKNGIQSTLSMFNEMYDTAKANYEIVQKKLKESTTQLNEAISELNAAQIKLNSLQSGLAAANTASLVSV